MNDFMWPTEDSERLLVRDAVFALADDEDDEDEEDDDEQDDDEDEDDEDDDEDEDDGYSE